VLVLSFDTATAEGSVALLRDGALLGERRTRAAALLAAADELLREAGAAPSDLDRLVVGIGPGSFTGLRVGLAAARGLALGRELPTAGVSSLAALAAAAPGALPVIDARRREIFVPGGVLAPADLEVEPGRLCVGSGAVRYRDVLEAKGADIPPDADERHLPRARFHAQLARDFGPAEEVEPLYLRLPDADKTRP
jgi:tRNA threonylcarbamoyladenosine biosynthesis protein TsaB